MDLHYPFAGATVLIGAVVFLKTLDFLAAQTVRRLLETAAGQCPGRANGVE